MVEVASGTDTNDYVDIAALALSGQDLTLTLERTGSLADVTATVTLPAAAAGSDDTKVVTALPDAVDVADDDKDKLWLVVPTMDAGIVEVAHFAPADDPTVFKMTAADFMHGLASYTGFGVMLGTGGHLEPSDTNIERIAFGHTFDNYEILFVESETTPFDWNDFATNGLTLYFREAGHHRQLATLPADHSEHQLRARIRHGAQPHRSLCGGDRLRRDHQDRERVERYGRLDGADHQPPSVPPGRRRLQELRR